MSKMRFRVALGAPPKSGAVWLQQILHKVGGAKIQTIASQIDFEWSALPEDVILRLYQPPTLAFRKKADMEEFKFLTISRHPYDVLVAILYTINFDTESNWARGNKVGLPESFIRGATPRHPSFIQFASLPIVIQMTSMSESWLNISHAIPLTYESISNDPAKTLNDALTCFNSSLIRCPVSEAVESTKNIAAPCSINEKSMNIACAGIWRKLLPSKQARRLYSIYGPIMERLDYKCDPNTDLSPEQADINWHVLLTKQLTDPLNKYITDYTNQLELIGKNVPSEIKALHQNLIDLCALSEEIARGGNYNMVQNNLVGGKQSKLMNSIRNYTNKLLNANFR